MAVGWKKQYSKYNPYFLNIVSLYKSKEDLRMFLEILLSLVTIALFGVFALRPTFLTIADLYQQIKTKEELIAKMDTKINNLQKAQSLLTQNSLAISLLETAVPAFPEPGEISRQLEGIAAKNAITITNLSINETPLKGKLALSDVKSDTALAEGASGVSFSLSISGPYLNLVTFLNDLESLRMPVKVDTLGLSVLKSEAGGLNMIVSARSPFM
jgi:hypothetical protein